MRRGREVKLFRSRCEESKCQGQEKDHESKGENSCESARPFGAGDLLGMRRMPLDAAEYVVPDFRRVHVTFFQARRDLLGRTVR